MWRSWYVWLVLLVLVILFIWLLFGGEGVDPDLEGVFPEYLYRPKERGHTPVDEEAPSESGETFELPVRVTVPLEESFVFQERDRYESDSDSDEECPPSRAMKASPQEQGGSETRASEKPAMPRGTKPIPVPVSAQAKAVSERGQLLNPKLLGAVAPTSAVNLDPYLVSAGEPATRKFISRGEAELGVALRNITGKDFENQVRPEILRSPESHSLLELDWYSEELRIGAEFNGVQHYQYPNYTGQTEEQFINQVRRDAYKMSACNANGIYLLTVPDTEAGNIEKYLRRIITEPIWERIRRGSA